MPLILKTKEDRRIWQLLTPNQREFAKNGKCINLTADYLPEDVPTRFVFRCIHEAIWEYVDKEHLEIEGFLRTLLSSTLKIDCLELLNIQRIINMLVIHLTY